MADNFNLRTFLSENKLTKNAQLLKEQQEDYRYFDEEGTGGFYMTTIDGVKIYSLEDSSIMDTCFYALEDEDGYIDFISIDVSGEPVSSEDIQNEQEVLSYIADFIEEDINSQLEEEGLLEASGSMKNKVDEAQYSDSYDTPAAKKVHGQLRDIVNIFDKSKSEEEQEIQAAIQAAEQETGSQVTPTEKRVLLQQASWIRTHDSQMERESVDNKKPVMKETKLTAKERRLVEMVNNAMDFSEGEENVDYTMGRQDDPNQLPNPAPELNIPEGEEMVQEKPMPKYESIDQLMKEIEYGTNEAAHKYKMEEMKRIYELLEAKVGSLEEGENAEHIDQKKVKQMRKDIAALRKAEEKLRKEFDKKFSGKEKKEAATKEKAAQALQEGFDLRKFLIENRK